MKRKLLLTLAVACLFTCILAIGVSADSIAVNTITSDTYGTVYQLSADPGLDNAKNYVSVLNTIDDLAKDQEALSVVTDGRDVSMLGKVLSQVDISSADVITVGVVTKEVWMISQPYIPADYSYELCLVGNDKYFPVIYNVACFENIYVNIEETDNVLYASVGKSEDEVCVISAYEKVADNRQENIDALLGKVSNSSSGAISTFIGVKGHNSEFQVTYEGVSVEYHTCIGVSGYARNVVAAVTDQVMDCYNKSCEAFDGAGALCLAVSARNIYCAEYLNLIS